MLELGVGYVWGLTLQLVDEFPKKKGQGIIFGRILRGGTEYDNCWTKLQSWKTLGNLVVA